MKVLAAGTAAATFSWSDRVRAHLAIEDVVAQALRGRDLLFPAGQAGAVEWLLCVHLLRSRRCGVQAGF